VCGRVVRRDTEFQDRASNAVLGESGLPWNSNPIGEMPIPSVGLALQARLTPRKWCVSDRKTGPG
jgi:hypothetical protein